MSRRQSNASDLCICKICICGRHHCPHQSIRKVPLGPCTLSEYTNEYTPHQLPSIHSYKPMDIYKRSSDPVESKTNHRIDYVPHPLEKRYVHMAEAYRAPEGEFEKNTSYTHDYTGKKGVPAKLFKRNEERHDLGKFDGVPMYQTDYKKWPISPRELHGRSMEWIPPTESFNGQPTYSTDYIQYENVRIRDSCKPNQEAQTTDKPFQGITNYTDSYKKPQLEQRILKEKVEWSAPSVPFMGDSTTHMDYKEKPLSLSHSYKPLSIAKLATEPLQNDTTHRVDYKPWGLERPFVRAIQEYTPPDGCMESNTTYLCDYVPVKGTRTEAFRPKVTRSEMDKFQGRTSYSDEYKRWVLQAREHCAPMRQYIPPDTPLDSKTTHGIDYVPHSIEQARRTMFKKGDERHYGNGPFDGKSIYKTEYQPFQITVCPTNTLESPRGEYMRTGQVSDTGHILLTPRLDSVDMNDVTEVAVAN